MTPLIVRANGPPKIITRKKNNPLFSQAPLTTCPVSNEVIPSEFSELFGKYYHFMENGEKFRDAYEECRDMGGDIANAKSHNDLMAIKWLTRGEIY